MKAFLSATVIAASMLAAAPASAVVIGFDDIISDVGETPILNGYADLYWVNFWAVHGDVYPEASYDTGTMSGSYVAFNGYGNPAFILATRNTFSFNGGWFTSAWYDGNELLIEGYADGSRTADYTMSVVLNTHTPLFLDVDWNGLRSLRFSTNNMHFVMDDLRINEGTSTEVPEPLTIGLLGMGLLGVAGARRRKG